MTCSRGKISYRYIETAALVLGLLLLVIPASAAVTTEVHLVKYASDHTTVLSEKTVSADWMSSNLPVLGDGSTHYYLQGPTFDQANLWDPAESKNVQEKDMGGVKGTNLKDLCNLVGGMASGDTIEVRSQDGFFKQFTYSSVYTPQPRQGPIGLVWYKADEGMVPAYQTGMRLVFFADISVNSWQLHVFGNSDMQATIPQDGWHYFNGVYPTTTGLSVQSVQEIRIYSSVAPQTATSQQTTVSVQTTGVVTTLQPTSTLQPTQVQVIPTLSLATTTVTPGTTQVVIPVTTVPQTITLTSTVPVTVGSTSVQTGTTQVSTMVSQTPDAGQTLVTTLTTTVPVNSTAAQQVILSAGTLPISSVQTQYYTPVPLTAATTMPTTTTVGGVALTSGITYNLGISQETMTQTLTPALTGFPSAPPALMTAQTTPGGQTQPFLQPTIAPPKSRSITGSVNLSFNLTAGGTSGNPAPLATGVSALLLWPLPLQIQASNLFEVFWWITRVLVR